LFLCLVFSQFIDTLSAVATRLKGVGISYIQLEGDMNVNKRREVLNTFNNDPKVKVFLLSSKSAGAGLTLNAANHCLFVSSSSVVRLFVSAFFDICVCLFSLMEPSLNPALETQAINRCYRLGQTKEVHIYRLVCAPNLLFLLLPSHPLSCVFTRELGDERHA
jgi:hypothetical protein